VSTQSADPSSAELEDQEPAGAKLPAPASVMRRVLPKLVLSIVLGGLFAWIVARGGVPLVPDAADFRAIAWWTAPAYLGILLVTHFVRAARWRYLIEPIKHLPLKEVILLNWMGFFAIFAFPLRLGEVARPALTKLRHAIPMSVGFGTVAVERVIDGLVTSLCVAWALFAIPRVVTDDPIAQSLPFYGYLMLAVFSGGLVALFAFVWQRARAVRLTEWMLGIVSKKLARVLAEKVSSVADGVHSLTDPRLAGGFIAESAVYWGLNALGMWVLALGVGLPIGFGHAVSLMGILAIGVLLPTGPGLFGNFQLAVSAGLRLYLTESLVAGPGSVYIFLLYGIQAAVILTLGIVPLYLSNVPLRALLGQTDARARVPAEST